MKKRIISILICFVLIFSTTEGTFATVKIVEKSGFEIIIDAKLCTYTDVQINVGGDTLLPLRAFLADMGVQNDNQHIIWNGKDRSITIYKDSIKIYLKIDSTKGYVNNKVVMLPTAPVLYKGKTYVPLRFAAQALNKRVEWNKNFEIAVICEQNKYDEVKGLIDKADAALREVKKYKVNGDFETTHEAFEIANHQVSTEVDNVNKVWHSTTARVLGGNREDYYSEDYLIKGMIYARNGVKEKTPKKIDEGAEIKWDEWEKAPVGDSIDSPFYFENDISKNMIMRRAEAKEYGSRWAVVAHLPGMYYAGLNVSYVGNEIILEGDIGPGLFSETKGYMTKRHTKIILDRNSFLCREYENCEIFTNIKTGKGFVFSTLEKYSEFNGDFEVTIPDEVKKLAGL